MISRISSSVNTGQPHLSWNVLSQLARRYGESFYLLNLETFGRNYRNFTRCFRSLYPNSTIAYSYKTNYTPRLCREVNLAGGYAEVVSDLEYQLALKVGVPPERIIYNGPCKRHEDLKKALLAGSIVNLDSFAEVDAVEAVARSAPRTTLRIGIRCNFPIEGEKRSRFGFDVAEGDPDLVVHRLRKLPDCELVGLHCHFSTGRKSLESYRMRTAAMLELCQRHFGPSGPRMIDIGGGFFSPMDDRLQALFGVAAPGFGEYAAATASQVAAAYPSHGPELVLEPGSALVANAMQFVARVVEIKNIGARRMAVVAGSIHNIKPTLHKKNMPVRLFGACETSSSHPPGREIDLVGYTCMEHDCLHAGCTQNVSVGDYAVFENVGAYTTVMKPPFIRPSPPIIAIETGGGGFRLVKHGETFDELFSTYLF